MVKEYLNCEDMESNINPFSTVVSDSRGGGPHVHSTTLIHRVPPSILFGRLHLVFFWGSLSIT